MPIPYEPFRPDDLAMEKPSRSALAGADVRGAYDEDVVFSREPNGLP
jgi:hypothetical protein